MCISVDVATSAVCDAVTDYGESGVGSWHPGFNGGDKVPVLCRVGAWVGHVSGRGVVAKGKPDVDSAAGVRGDVLGGLAGFEVEGYGYDLSSIYGEIDRV